MTTENKLSNSLEYREFIETAIDKINSKNIIYDYPLIQINQTNVKIIYDQAFKNKETEKSEWFIKNNFRVRPIEEYINDTIENLSMLGLQDLGIEYYCKMVGCVLTFKNVHLIKLNSYNNYTDTNWIEQAKHICEVCANRILENKMKQFKNLDLRDTTQYEVKELYDFLQTMLKFRYNWTPHHL